MPKRPWTIITSHGIVLLYLAAHTDTTVRSAARELDITERQVYRIIRDLEEEELLKVYRRPSGPNVYAANLDAPLRHQRLNGLQVRDLLVSFGPALLQKQPTSESDRSVSIVNERRAEGGH